MLINFGYIIIVLIDTIYSNTLNIIKPILKRLIIIHYNLNLILKFNFLLKLMEKSK